jgi:hypothetical protein
MPVPSGVGDDGLRSMGRWHRCGLVRRHDFQQQAFVEAGMTVLARASVSDNIAGAVAALLGSRR